MHHNAQYENHTRQIEFEKKKKAREMLNEQIKENNEKKHKAIEEEKQVFKANYGPEETLISKQILGDKRENEKVEMTTDLTAQMAQKQNLVRFYRDTQLMEDKRQEEAL